MWTIFKVCIEFVMVLFLSYVLAVLTPGRMRSTPDQEWRSHTLALEGRVLTTDHQEGLNCSLFNTSKHLQFSINFIHIFSIFNFINSKFARLLTHKLGLFQP